MATEKPLRAGRCWRLWVARRSDSLAFSWQAEVIWTLSASDSCGPEVKKALAAPPSQPLLDVSAQWVVGVMESWPGNRCSQKQRSYRRCRPWALDGFGWFFVGLATGLASLAPVWLYNLRRHANRVGVP